MRRAFSFPVMCMFLLIPVIFGFCVRNIAEPDIWWHLRNGEQMTLLHSIPRTDTLSFGAAGAPWLAHEWLSEIAYFVAFHAAGLTGLLTLYFALLVLIYAGVYYRSCREGADCKSAVLTTLLAVLLGVVSIGPRMLLFGWLCMIVLLILLDRYRHSGSGLWLIPPLFLLWVNLHGSWVFGLIVLAITIGAGLFEGSWGLVVAEKWSPAQLKTLLAVFGASLVTLFVNPFGYKLPLYPFDLLFRQSSNLKYIEEWQSVDFGTGGGKVVLILLFLLLGVALFSNRRWRLDEAILVAFALWQGLSHARLMFFTGLIIPPLIASRLTFFPPYDPEIDKPWLNLAIMAGLLAGVGYYYPSNTVLQRDIDGKYPAAALSFIEQHHLEGRIFNTDWWGGYMEWHARDIKPFVDGRADIFVYNGTFDDHVSAGQIRDSLAILDKYKIDYVLLEKKRPLTYLLEHAPGWQQLYIDNVAAVFGRTKPTSETSAELK